ncbi:sigma-70 family RNA polymerase sigma factor [Cupriavidus basilensis]|uniref:RNA polymerase sigma-70 factor, ECF subfamily n=1 Tax=Cupriavidus basilensis TaxID=68895 RepID=A0A0C4YME5_9BURK|nr:sigma-70 family RNA polymerase sigma factor [Cupriavidus basilensis]AJG23745.1 RNA polymerase sigma-70 factor, ECF subfamily [Cupriavidus basilensis]
MVTADTLPQSELHALYRNHHGWLVNLLWRKLGNADNAADLAQDTFARLLVACDASSLREPRAYLTTVASRLTAQYFRRLALERAYLEALALQPEAAAPSPETRALVVEALTAVSTVLEQLPPRVCEAFLLSQLDGLAYKDIAQRLGVTVNVVQKWMSKAFLHCYTAVYG